MRRTGLLLSATLGLFAGCAGPIHVGLEQLLSEARSNELAFHGKYTEKRVTVSGQVTVVSLHKQRTVEHSYGPSGPSSLGGEMTSREAQRNMPYLYLVSPSGGEGRVLCFFPEADYAAAASVSPGQQRTLECTFQDYVKRGKDRVVVLNTCGLVD